jgi:hypothetical protein
MVRTTVRNRTSAGIKISVNTRVKCNIMFWGKVMNSVTV